MYGSLHGPGDPAGLPLPQAQSRGQSQPRLEAGAGVSQKYVFSSTAEV